MAYFERFRPDWYERWYQMKSLLILSLIGFGIAMWSHYSLTYYKPWNYIGFRFFGSIASFYLLTYVIRSKGAFFHNKQLIFLGKLSYSMYLFHNFIPGFLLGVPFPENIYGRLVLYLVVLIAISYLAWQLIEMPFNRLKGRFRY